jgi:UDP-3-O-[3-hydroxymyristoyl] glucosamine N-acyltransferase
VHGIASLDKARRDELSFVRSAAMRDEALGCDAGVLIVPQDFEGLDRPGLVAANVDLAVALISDFVIAQMLPSPAPGAHADATVSPNASLGEGASIGPMAVIEDGVVVGARAHVGAGTYLGRGAAIGDDTILHPNVTVHWNCVVGSRCIIHSGAVVGADGFGYGKNPDGSYRKINQIGNVLIEDDVEIGACTCIDRATFDSTVIRRGVKLDNLVHIAHNCDIGRDTAMAAQVGIAGSTRIGRGGEFGGQSGVVGHVVLGERVRVGAASPVIKSFPDGIELWGFPAREKSQALREMAASTRGVKFAKELKRLRNRIEEIEQSLMDGD